MNISESLTDFKIVLVSHVFTRGPAHELEAYLQNKCEELLFIGHPFYNSSLDRTYYKIHAKNSVKELKSRISRKRPIIDFILDLLKTLAFVSSRKEKYDLLVGAGALDAFAGLILKKFGIVDFVIFYSIDYVPKRFNNAFLNRIYHWMDKLCASQADAVWNLSEKMIEERTKRGIDLFGNIQQIVPIGTNFDEIQRSPEEQIERYTFAYLGTLAEKQGLQLMLEALPELTRQYPMIKLIVIGEGPYRKALEDICESNGISHAVEFRGEIKNDCEVESILTRCIAGIATYKPGDDNFAYFTDVGKPKYYAACGLTPVITRVPPISSVIEQLNAGYVIQYKKDELVGAISSILENGEEHLQKRRNAIALASNFRWNAIFDKALIDSLGRKTMAV